MPRDGRKTREKILDAAQGLIIDHGYGATTVDKVIEAAGITKGTFFYHFDTKAELGNALIRRYVDMDLALLNTTMEQAERLSRDPLQQLLIFVGLLIETVSPLCAENQESPGCLIASYAYQRLQFEDEINALMRDTFLVWRAAVGGKIRGAMANRPPRMEVEPDSLADMFMSTFEGGYVMGKVLEDPSQLIQHLNHFRNYLELLFSEK